MGREEYNAPKFSFSKAGLLPQEEMLEVKTEKRQVSIGIPKEDHSIENRVSVTPEAVELLIQQGYRIIIESNAGQGANYSDHFFSERGADITDNTSHVFQADIILKVAPLTFQEIDMLKGNQLLISSLHFNNHTKEMVQRLIERRVTALAFENIKDEHNCFPVVKSMSAIAGNTSILVAAEYLSNSRKGKGVMLGGITGITPTEVVIIGAGTAAEFATRAAVGMGAMVRVFDNSLHDLRQLQNNIGTRLYTSVYHPRVLERTLRSADVVIGAIRGIEKKPRYWITEEMVKNMKKGSVIVDVSIDQGGCIETSECRTQKDPVFEKFGVIHYCVPNLPSIVARTATIALSNVMVPLLQELALFNGITPLIKENVGIRHGIYIYNGLLTNKFMGHYFDIPSKDIDLLMAAF
jgi:alanine dehydrogenase